MNADEFFATDWPQMLPRLRATLARAGVPAREREDLLQESAARLLGMWSSVDPDRPVEALARRIALNAWRDQWRQTGRREVVGEVPETLSTDFTAQTAMARVQVREVSRALSDLPSGAAQLLRDAAQAEWSGREQSTPASVRMARTRARRALAAVLQTASAALGGLVVSCRKVGRHTSAVTASAALVGLAFVFAVGLPVDGSRGGIERSEGQQRPAIGKTQPSARMRAHESLVAPVVKAARHPARQSRPDVPYYVVDVGQTSLATFAEVNVGSAGLQVRDPGDGSRSPACGRGVLVAPPVLAACPS